MRRVVGSLSSRNWIISEYDSMAIRSATRSSRIIAIVSSPSMYSLWLRESMPSGLKFGSPPSCVMRSAIWSACRCSSAACSRNSAAAAGACRPVAMK